MKVKSARRIVLRTLLVLLTTVLLLCLAVVGVVYVVPSVKVIVSV